MEKIEITVLKNLVYNEDYARKVVPFINLEYFELRTEKVICEEIIDFISQYDKLPTPEILQIEISNREDLTEQEFKDIRGILPLLIDDDINNDWLFDATEKWCRDRAIYLALMDSIRIADGKDDKEPADGSTGAGDESTESTTDDTQASGGSSSSSGSSSD